MYVAASLYIYESPSSSETNNSLSIWCHFSQSFSRCLFLTHYLAVCVLWLCICGSNAYRHHLIALSSIQWVAFPHFSNSDLLLYFKHTSIFLLRKHTHISSFPLYLSLSLSVPLATTTHSASSSKSPQAFSESKCVCVCVCVWFFFFSQICFLLLKASFSHSIWIAKATL